MSHRVRKKFDRVGPVPHDWVFWMSLPPLPRRLLTAALLPLLLAACGLRPPCGPGGCAADDALAAKVRTALDSHPALMVNPLYVQVIGDAAYVTGGVDSDLERQEVHDIVAAVPGIKTVDVSVSILSNMNF